MKPASNTTPAEERRSEPRHSPEEYHCVEFSLDDLAIPYQFKIWNIASKSMCLLVRQDSDILRRIKVGDTVNMKYYSGCSWSSGEYKPTAIRHITKNDEGPFKGHYLVGIEILSSDAAPHR